MEDSVEDVHRALHVLQHVGRERGQIITGDPARMARTRVLGGEQRNLSGCVTEADRSTGRSAPCVFLGTIVPGA